MAWLAWNGNGNIDENEDEDIEESNLIAVSQFWLCLVYGEHGWLKDANLRNSNQKENN